MGTPGRTGHDYENRFVGDDFHWYGRTKSRLGQPSIDSLINPVGFVYIFHREESLSPFIFAGIANAKSVNDETPAQITWEFSQSAEHRPEVLAEEVTEPEKYVEGPTKTISVNTYERNPHARKKCVELYGYSCSVCGFNFGESFGDHGEGFIHVAPYQSIRCIRRHYQTRYLLQYEIAVDKVTKRNGRINITTVSHKYHGFQVGMR